VASGPKTYYLPFITTRYGRRNNNIQAYVIYCWQETALRFEVTYEQLPWWKLIK